MTNALYAAKEVISPSRGWVGLAKKGAVVVAILLLPLLLGGKWVISNMTGDSTSSSTPTAAEAPAADPFLPPAPVDGSPATAQPARSAATIDGTYEFTATLTSGPCKTNGAHQFDVTTSGADPNRRVSLDGGGVSYVGPLRPDNSFEATAPLLTGTGTDSFTGAFDLSATPVALIGLDTLTDTGPDFGNATCTFRLAGHKT
jgi:hypothetical protein